MKPRRRWRRVLGGLLIIALLVALTPLALTALYADPRTQPGSTLMLLDRLTGGDVRRDWVAFEDISPAVWQSVVSSEDGQFCAHDGVDWPALRGQVEAAIDGEPTRGASTIPMQTVKNVFLWSGRSYVRKVVEVPLAMLADRAWGKKRLMEIYLNVAEWGDGIYGIEAAAQHYFGRSAKRLSRPQAARLTVVLPNPLRRNPVKLTRTLGLMAQRVERRAKASGAYVGCLR